MSTAQIQPMMLVIELLAVIQLVRFWRAIQSRGYFDPIIRQYHTAFMADCMAAFLFVVQLVIALHDWLGLPLDALGIATWVVFGSFFALVWVNCRGRLEHDSATRTLVALNALDALISKIHL
jgi:hypothetical protein